MSDDTVNPCCKDKRNLEDMDQAQAKYPDGSDAGTLYIRRCKVCGRFHYEHIVTPLSVGVKT